MALSLSEKKKRIPKAGSKKAKNLNPTTDADRMTLQAGMRIALREQHTAAYRVASAYNISFYPVDKKKVKGKFSGEFILPRPKDWDKLVSPCIRVDVTLRNFPSDQFDRATIEKKRFDKITFDKKPILYIEVYTDDVARIWQFNGDEEILFHEDNIKGTTVVKTRSVKKLVGELNYSEATLVKLKPVGYCETPYKNAPPVVAKPAEIKQAPLF